MFTNDITGKLQDNCNCDGYATSIFTITGKKITKSSKEIKKKYIYIYFVMVFNGLLIDIVLLIMQ